MKADSEFIKTTVHELNNFLSAISGFAELSLMDLDSDSELASYLSEIMLAVNRSSEFNQQLLMMSGAITPTAEEIDAEFIQKLLTELKLGTRSFFGNDEHFIGNKSWLKKSFKAIQEFSYSIANENPELSIIKHAQTVGFKFEIDLKGREIDLTQFFQPYYSSRTLVSEKGLGLCWLPPLMKHLGGRAEVKKLEQEKVEIALNFKI